MKKDKEWLKEELTKQIDILHTTISSGNYVKLVKRAEIMGLINQLDEPELPVIPQFVADWIEESKGVDDDFWEAATEMIRDSITSLTKKGRKVHDWLFGNSVIVTVMLERQKLITRAWLDGYTIEKEKRYYVYDKATKSYLGYNVFRTQLNWWTSRLEKESFTEQEIKAIDERYWAFAEEVTE